MGFKRSIGLLSDDSIAVNLSAVCGSHEDSPSSARSSNNKHKLEIKNSISEDLSKDDERRRKRLCCLTSRIDSKVPGKSYMSTVVETQSTTSKGKTYGCKNCRIRLSVNDDIISRNFRGQHGKAYLFDRVLNIEEGEPELRNMTTGRHTCRDISCRRCKETVGWKFDKAFETSEKYKEGKFILEADLICVI